MTQCFCSKGDTGGPLVLEDADGIAVLTGVTSFVSANGCHSTDPAGFTRLSPYLSWIKNETGVELNL